MSSVASSSVLPPLGLLCAGLGVFSKTWPPTSWVPDTQAGKASLSGMKQPYTGGKLLMKASVLAFT